MYFIEMYWCKAIFVRSASWCFSFGICRFIFSSDPQCSLEREKANLNSAVHVSANIWTILWQTYFRKYRLYRDIDALILQLWFLPISDTLRSSVGYQISVDYLLVVYLRDECPLNCLLKWHRQSSFFSLWLQRACLRARRHAKKSCAYTQLAIVCSTASNWRM
jgi:hypothetical protein